MKLLFFMPTLIGGGAEKVLLTLVNNLDYTEFDVTVLTLINKGVYIDKLNKGIKFKSIIKTKNAFLQRLLSYAVQFIIPAKIIHKIFIGNKYDTEIAYLEGYPIKLISASGNKQSKKLGWVHASLNSDSGSEKIFGSIGEAKECYKKLDKIIFVSKECKDSFIERYGITENLYVQYNVIDDNIIKQKSLEAQNGLEKRENGINLIAVGRLMYVKGFERLITVVKRLADVGYDVRLFILGEGELKQKIENQIAELNLEDKVVLLGFKENPYPYIKAADALVCSSFSEGFSTVATEAVILEKPVITTECAGMKELLGENNEYGIVVPNSEDGIYEGIKSLFEGKIEAYNRAVKKRSGDFSKTQRIEEHRRLFNGKY